MKLALKIILTIYLAITFFAYIFRDETKNHDAAASAIWHFLLIVGIWSLL
jgi:hypothetical protein